mgnify:CR=1 FL=1
MSKNYSVPEILSQAAPLVKKTETRWPELGALLWELHQKVTPGEFQRLAKELGMGQRMAYYLVSIHECFTRRLKRPIPEDIPWRTLCEVTDILTWDNAERLLAFCRAHSREQVLAALKTKTLRK